MHMLLGFPTTAICTLAGIKFTEYSKIHVLSLVRNHAMMIATLRPNCTNSSYGATTSPCQVLRLCCAFYAITNGAAKYMAALKVDPFTESPLQARRQPLRSLMIASDFPDVKYVQGNEKAKRKEQRKRECIPTTR